jgi:hypothetical protein
MEQCPRVARRHQLTAEDEDFFMSMVSCLKIPPTFHTFTNCKDYFKLRNIPGRSRLSKEYSSVFQNTSHPFICFTSVLRHPRTSYYFMCVDPAASKFRQRHTDYEELRESVTAERLIFVPPKVFYVSDPVSLFVWQISKFRPHIRYHEFKRRSFPYES